MDEEFHDGVHTPTKVTPSDQVYGPLQAAFTHFNRTLFDGGLLECLITLQRKGNTFGYFSPKKFAAVNGDARTDEIAMNPAHFRVRTPVETCATLVHEMVHQLREQQDDPPRSGYHDKVWAQEMLVRGLMPSSTGAPGGKMTGYRVSHYILPDGPFAQSYAAFEATGTTIGWGDAAVLGADEKAKPKRFKFVCPQCGENVHGKAATDVRCNPCDTVMVLAGKPSAELECEEG